MLFLIIQIVSGVSGQSLVVFVFDFIQFDITIQKTNSIQMPRKTYKYIEILVLTRALHARA